MLQCSAWQQNLPSSMDLLRPGDMVKTDTGRGRGAAVQKKNSQGWCVRHIFPAELACTHGANICIVYTHQPYHHIAAGVNYSNEVAWPMTPTTGQLSSLPCQFSFDRCWDQHNWCDASSFLVPVDVLPSTWAWCDSELYPKGGHLPSQLCNPWKLAKFRLCFTATSVPTLPFTLKNLDNQERIGNKCIIQLYLWTLQLAHSWAPIHIEIIRSLQMKTNKRRIQLYMPILQIAFSWALILVLSLSWPHNHLQSVS